MCWHRNCPNPDCEIPYGRCHCRCGGETRISTQNNRKYGEVKGEPRRYIAGHHKHKSPVAWIEEDRGYETPCWVWQRAKDRNGYGMKRHNGRLHPAHRVVYEDLVGPIPPVTDLDHLCRVRDCVNPAHMEPVTHPENIRRGSNVKLTPEAIREIRAAPAHYGYRKALAERFGVNASTIRYVRNGSRWSEVT